MRIGRTLMVLFALTVLVMPLSVRADSVTLYAAGSLKAALSDVAAAYENAYQIAVNTKFGPSGLLRKAIEAGEKPDVFASANMDHPEALAAKGWGGPVVLFTRNQLCTMAQPNVAVSTNNLLDVLLDKDIRLGTSTPKADPSGDYAWELFTRADALKKGSFATLSGKALQLTGGPDSVKAPEGRNQYGWVMGEKKADVFLTYCTNAVLARKEIPKLQIIRIPADLAVGADYGLLVRKDGSADAWRLAMFILSPKSQKILSDYGFEAAAIPAGE
jgi:molybdate transport system substrate-binding protein